MLFVSGPPREHERLQAFNCTENNAAPVLDLIWGTLNLLGALAATSDPEGYENPGQIVAVGFGWTLLSGVSAATGFDKTSRCRAAKEALLARLRQVPTNPAVVQDHDLRPELGIQEVTVHPGAVELKVGETSRLIATAHRSDGSAIPNQLFTWSSSNDAIASVSRAGLLTAHAPGSVVIAANTNNVVGTARVSVSQDRR